MEYQSEEETDYSEVIDNLMHMFGTVLDKDAIATVVESCGGDLNISIDTIMNITSESNVVNEDTSKVEDNPENISVNTVNTDIPQNTPSSTMSFSYASASQARNNQTGAIRKIQKTIPPFWTDQLRNIITNHNHGYRIMVIMRGLPGSGKSYLAKQLVEMMIGPDNNSQKAHIFSTDDYFVMRGQFDKFRLSEAHLWNQNRVKNATLNGLSPIIVDNTNVELWEMQPYAQFAVAMGYTIEVVEPNTPWARKANQLFRRNTHNVPLNTIERKLEMYQDGVTGDSLRRAFGLSYPADKVPPVNRTIPKINTIQSSVDTKVNNAQSSVNTGNNKTSEGNTTRHTNPFLNPFSNKDIQKVDLSSEARGSSFKNDEIRPEMARDSPTDQNKLKQKLQEAEKVLQEIQKFEQEWDKGDQWDTPSPMAISTVKKRITKSVSKPTALPSLVDLHLESKPPRFNNPKPNQQSDDGLMKTVNDCQDWSQISLFMNPWVSSSESTSIAQNVEIPVDTKSSATCMEIGDTDLNGSKKLMTATARNINEGYMPLNKEKIPNKRMLDKSIMTNEDFLTSQFRCSNEEKHFIAFCKLFKTVERSALRDIFDKCCGDVNWAVEIVLDGMVNKQFKTVEVDDISDEEDDCVEQCECLASYNVIPDVKSTSAAPLAAQSLTNIQNEDEERSDNTQQPQKKKREIMSEENKQIKRRIEQNVVISDDHYSEHCLKIRNMRRGENVTPNILEQPSTSSGMYDPSQFLPENESVDEDEADDDSNSDDGDTMVSVCIGWNCVKELDRMFGRQDMEYPKNIVPKISIPLEFLNQINALWIESLMYQMDIVVEQSAEMIKRDEEFAREIARKENELSQAGIEPEIPDFKEIMDMDLALSLYQKDVAEWRNNMPTDLAAKMTRDKLHNLFPDVDKDTLTELLMAHDNNFKSTVEILLMSTGRTDVLETENGVNKFVMEREMQRQEKILEERRKELSEHDWPLLTRGEKVDMSTVTAYRNEADQHLDRCNSYHQKAQDFMGRGMPQVANYYSEIARYHRLKYDHTNSLAVTALMQYHAMNTPDSLTIDLHYLRVKEAMESLDVFLDTHIQRLREDNRNTTVTVFIITGRGKNSVGKARIKPATKKRLDERGLRFAEGNPGLLHARLLNSSKLAYQIQVP